jgi:hypothetical protein
VGLYNSYTAENVGNLRGHNSKVGGAAGHVHVSGLCCGGLVRTQTDSDQRQPTKANRIQPNPTAQVRSLSWSFDDSRVITSGADGAVYEWRVADLKRWVRWVARCLDGD